MTPIDAVVAGARRGVGPARRDDDEVDVQCREENLPRSRGERVGRNDFLDRDDGVARGKDGKAVRFEGRADDVSGIVGP